MKFRRFLARHVPGFQLIPMPGATGARGRRLFHHGDAPLGPYQGPYDQHVLMLVHEGTMTLERHGGCCEAQAGDAMLIGRGEEGRLMMNPCRNRHRFVMDVMVFDERALAKVLRNHYAWESLAVSEEGDAPTAFTFRDFGFRGGSSLASPIDTFSPAISLLLGQYRPGVAEFLREHFYHPRWMLCIFLEQFVTTADGAKQAAKKYPGGTNQLRRDCLLYLGTQPEAVLTKRRCELATAWLRCGHSITEVAQALGYSSQGEFECSYCGVTKTRCRDVQERTPLAEVAIDELIASIQPYWWNSRILSIDQAPSERHFDDQMMSQAEEEAFAAAEPQWQELTVANRQTRWRMADELREKAADFFAMKKSGADLIVPIFKYAPPVEEDTPPEEAAA